MLTCAGTPRQSEPCVRPNEATTSGLTTKAHFLGMTAFGLEAPGGSIVMQKAFAGPEMQGPSQEQNLVPNYKGSKVDLKDKFILMSCAAEEKSIHVRRGKATTEL